MTFASYELVWLMVVVMLSYGNGIAYGDGDHHVHDCRYAYGMAMDELVCLVMARRGVATNPLQCRMLGQRRLRLPRLARMFPFTCIISSRMIVIICVSIISIVSIVISFTSIPFMISIVVIIVIIMGVSRSSSAPRRPSRGAQSAGTIL